METTWTATFLIIAGLIVFLIGAAYLIAKIGARNAKEANEYERQYGWIQNIISSAHVCEANYEWILKLLKKLGQLPYKNRERSEVLTVEFFTKYKDIAEKQVNEND